MKPYIVIFELSGLNGNVRVLEPCDSHKDAIKFFIYLQNCLKSTNARVALANEYFPGAVLEGIVGAYDIQTFTQIA